MWLMGAGGSCNPAVRMELELRLYAQPSAVFQNSAERDLSNDNCPEACLRRNISGPVRISGTAAHPNRHLINECERQIS
jgi:hypothetical protein